MKYYIYLRGRMLKKLKDPGLVLCPKNSDNSFKRGPAPNHDGIADQPRIGDETRAPSGFCPSCHTVTLKPRVKMPGRLRQMRSS